MLLNEWHRPGSESGPGTTPDNFNAEARNKIVNTMTPQEFCYWLQGYTELGGERPTEAQWKMIREHLALAFQKVTPPLSPWTPPLAPMPTYPQPVYPSDWPQPPEITCYC